jgi:hypothetical protein
MKGCSVQQRMESVESGRSVSALDDGATQTTFLSADADTAVTSDYAMAEA